MLDKEINYNYSNLPVFIDKIDLSKVLFHTDLHTHLDIEIIYILKGSIDYTIEDKTITLIRDNGLFINSGRLHHGFSNTSWDCEFIKINISPNILTKVDASYKDNYQSLFYDLDDYIEINRFNHRDLIGVINELYLQKDEDDSLMIISCIFKLFSLIKKELKNPKDKSSRSTNYFKKVLEYVYAHYQENVTIDDICKELHISRNTCCRLFLEYTGTSFVNYLTLYRLNMAVEMLKDDNKSVSQIAIDCGFSSASYFSTNFKKYIDMSPKQYQIKYRNKL